MWGSQCKKPKFGSSVAGNNQKGGKEVTEQEFEER